MAWSLLIFLLQQTQIGPAQTHHLGVISSAGALDELVMLQALSGQAQMDLYLLHMQTHAVERVTQANLPKTIYRILPMQEGFAVFGHLVNRIYELDGKGQFLSQTELRDFEGSLPEMIVAEIFSWGRGQALLSFEINDSDALFLARLDLSSHKLEILGNFPIEGEGSFSFAYPFGDHFLLCDKSTGSIKQVHASGEICGPELLPPLTLERTAQFGEAEAADKLSARLKWRSRITDPLPCADGFSFNLITKFASATGPEFRQTKQINPETSAPRNTEFLQLHRYKDQRLVWDLVSGNLIFLKD